MEERNIKISLEKAKEWYEQGGDLREAALQAFSEDELIDKYPSNWKDYILKVNSAELIDADDIKGSVDYCYFKTKEEAEAFVALGKLIQLRDEYWELDNNWKPDWRDDTTKYCIHSVEETLSSETWGTYNRILAFRTEELCDKFFNNFEDLIEQAKMFL